MTHPDAVALATDEECPVCRFVRGPLAVCLCEYERAMSDWRAMLAHNLATASALCAAFWQGYVVGNGSRPIGPPIPGSWHPGCQRSAL